MQIILRDIVIQNQTNELSIDLVNGSDQISESVKYATIMVATIPIMMVYPFIQKYFVKGIMGWFCKGLKMPFSYRKKGKGGKRKGYLQKRK